MQSYTVKREHDYQLVQFKAMASPCQLFVNSHDCDLVSTLANLTINETKRIEQKYSRYRTDNIIAHINQSNNTAIEVDDETANLLDYAQICYEISDGLFDITSGLLRKAWKFDGSSNVPDQSTINDLLTHIGWYKVDWQRPYLTLPNTMEIDVGGIGKEYCVDRCIELISSKTEVSCLVNFGGDIRATAPRQNNQPWIVGIEDPELENQQKHGAPHIRLSSGAVATSGDTKRHVIKDGVYYGHVINPKTGWPPTNGPRTVTVMADTCTEAGILATLAMLAGKGAESFLQDQCTDYWCEW